MYGIGVVPAHILLIYGLRIMSDRSVILSCVPYLLELVGQLDHVGDLRARVALVQII